MSQNLILNHLKSGISELVISQPKRRNAINAAMWASLPEELEKAKNDRNIKVLVVRGDGDHFASGADISEFETLYATLETAAKISADIAAAFDVLAAFPVPTIAMIRGACVGGGCGLALCCDLRFADSSSKFAITPARLGLVYPFSDVQRLVETVGIPNAKDILFSARPITIERAAKMGLVNEVYEPGVLEQEVMAYADNLTVVSRQSSIVTKKMFAAYNAGQRGETAELQDWFLQGFGSDDFREGYQAFLEKRPPNFG